MATQQGFHRVMRCTVGPHALLPAAPQIKSIWSVLLRNFDFEMLDPVPEPDYDSMVIGPKAARVRYVRRKL